MTGKEYEATKNYLYAAINMNKEINKNIRRIFELRQMLAGSALRYKPDMVQASNGRDVVGDILSECIDLEEETDRLTDEYIDLKERLSDEIGRIEKEKHRKVLAGKYIRQNSLYALATEFDVSDRTCKTWHKEAVEKFFSMNQDKILHKG